MGQKAIFAPFASPLGPGMHPFSLLDLSKSHAGNQKKRGKERGKLKAEKGEETLVIMAHRN